MIKRPSRPTARGLMRLFREYEPVDRSTEHGRARDRDRRATLTSMAGVASRLASVGVSLVTVPILLSYLGVERYGVWLTVTAGVAWLGLLQFGLAPSLVNRLSQLEDGEAATGRQLVSTSFWLALGLAVAALVPLAALLQFASWSEIFNVDPGPLASDARAVTALVWLGFAISLPGGIATAVLRARQEGYVANAWELAGAAVRLLVITALVAADAGLVGLAAGITVTGLLVNVGLMGQTFVRSFPTLRPSRRSFDARVGGALLKTGVAFTGIGIAALVISYTDVIVITQLFGPAQVPPYAIAYSLLALFVSLEFAVLDAAWPAYSEAAARGDWQWVSDAHRRVTRLLIGGSVAFATLIVALGEPVIRFWAGPDATPPGGLLPVIGAIALIQAYQLAHGRLLTSLGHVRTNTVLGLLNAAINLPLSIALATQFGVTGVAIGTLVGYALTGAINVALARAALKRGMNEAAAVVLATPSHRRTDGAVVS